MIHLNCCNLTLMILINSLQHLKMLQKLFKIFMLKDTHQAQYPMEKHLFRRKIFYALELTDYFSIIVISEAIGLRKPDPEIYLYTCNQLDCKPSDCIFIETIPKQIQKVPKIGMKTIYFHPTLTLHPSLSDASIHHYDELEETVRRLINPPHF